MQMTISWVRYKVLILDLFVAVNFAFLTLDIYLAHSFNAFRHEAEWIPFYFSPVAAVLLTIMLFRRYQGSQSKSWFWSGLIVGMIAILVGIVGMLLHLGSHFFSEQSIRNLVYTAPFAAPLAYAGLGFLLLLNRMVSPQKAEWGQWLVFFSAGGFFGNFVLSLCDHAQNGFFNVYEWIPVVAGAFAVGFLVVAIFRHEDAVFLRICYPVMGLQIVVGLLGFGFHLAVDLQGASGRFLDDVIYGAPLLAPLLFPNLGVLAWFGLADLRGRVAG